MDLKRIIILIPLAILAYLLVVQWNQDYHQPTPEPQAPTLAANSSDATQPSDVLDAPESTSERATSPLENGQSANPAQENASSSLISVDTDVLDLRIDPRGGDIIYAALPEQQQALNSETPFVLLSDSSSRSYIARSGLQLENHPGRIIFSPERTDYRLADGERQLVVELNANVDGIAVTKRYTFERGSYAVKIDYLVDNQSAEPATARFIGQLARDQSADPTTTGGMGMKSYLGAAFSSPDSRYEKVSFDDIRNGRFANRDVQGGWVAVIQHYFVSAWVPNPNQSNLFYGDVDAASRTVAAFAGPSMQVAAGSQGDFGATLYIGPKIQSQLAAAAPNLELTVDYGWLWFLAAPLFWLLSKIHGLVGNWGWSIVLLTCVVKAILLPLSAKAYKSMAKMRKMGPEMQRIKELHGDDRQKMSQEMMKFYQKEKINPLGGCLPMVVQMPVFIALYWMLMESVELRHAPFMLWIQDLSAMDPYFILPILMGLSMFVQQQLNPTPPDPTQAKIMKMLPIIFTFFFLWFPAGLVLYWITNNVLSIAQQYMITKQIEKADEKREAQKKAEQAAEHQKKLERQKQKEQNVEGK
ncbi:membrane protein insertase YidC [Halotalea alkalilenta]|uniref:membrane protein insertase YidC n=1 Tax=Halotalea alkalilenta TaxID=376489 RepID=UPI0009E008A3|nr:membrane protein insertase YidC [Halotalea alkalilenta]